MHERTERRAPALEPRTTRDGRAVRAAALAVLLASALPRGGAATDEVALQALVERALVASPALAGARAALDAARAGQRLARVPYRPQAAVSETWTATDDPVYAFMSVLEQGRFTPQFQARIDDPPTVEDWTTRLSVRWLATDFGRRAAALAGAAAEVDRHALLVDAAERDVRFAVTEAYHAVRAARARIALREESVRVLTRHEQLAEDRFTAGTVLRSDVLAVGVRLARAREDHVAARHDVERALAALARAVGEPVDPGRVPPAAGGLGAPVYDRDEDVVVEATRQRHPAVAALAAAVRAASHGLTAARRGRRPALGVEAGGQWHGDDESPGFDRGSYRVAVSLDWRFADGGLAAARGAEAAARREQVEAARRELADSLDLAARTAHWQALESMARVSIADAAVDAADAAVGILEERYRAGLVPVIDLLDAERERTAARSRAIEARAAAWTAVAAVERFAGSEDTP